MEECQENYPNLITSIVATGVLIFSEILPFINSLEGNGLVHSIVAKLKKTFPVSNTPPQLPI
jgi:hypothetical protein